MDILRTFEALKVFVRDEKDTFIGLVFFILLGLGVIRYVLIPIFPQLDAYIIYISPFVAIGIVSVWFYNRHIPISPNEFTIAVAPFNILMLDAKANLSGEAKRDLKNELVDYVHTALYFNRENLALDKYIEVIRLPNRIKVKPKNDKKIVKNLNVDLMIWGDAYYDGEFLHFRPRFEFLKEPKNIFYKQFKKKLNELDSFKIELSKSVEDKKTNLIQLMHYISYLGVMFHGIELSYKNEFEEARKAFEFSMKSMGDKAFSNKSLSDIYLATRFFYAKNFHEWGNYVLKENKQQALKQYERGAKAFFKRATEMGKLKENKETKLENTLLYGIYLLMKKADYKGAEKKLDSIKKQFDKTNIYLYYLYKGLVQLQTKKAEPFFDKAIKSAKKVDEKELSYEKIADYFFSKGKFSQSTKYFEKRLKLSEKQIYHPSLLEEDVHRDLSYSYAKQLKLISAVKEKTTQILNQMKNDELEKKVLIE